MDRKALIIAGISAAVLVSSTVSAHSQAKAAPVEPQIVVQAQTVRIPIQAMEQETAQPVRDLQPSDLTLYIADKPAAFQLSRPWSHTIDPKTGQPEDRPNVLIVLPLGDPEPRNRVLNDAIHDLGAQPGLGWNVSILDDSGNQTSYTRDMKTVIADLKSVRDQSPGDVDLDDWRKAATEAIASMRELPGRRVVLSLGDLFHEVLFSGNRLAYDNFEVREVGNAARDAGATIYCADSLPEIETIRQLYPDYLAIGVGPWLVRAVNGDVAGWISNSVGDTVRQIQRDAMGAYDLDLHLDLNEMNGQLRAVALSARRPGIFFNAPVYFVAPDLAEIEFLSKLSPSLRNALQNPPAAGATPLQVATQLNYFPHADGKTGTQIATTEFFWNKAGSPPQTLDLAAKMTQTNIGYLATVMRSQLHWISNEPAWNAQLNVRPGTYMLRIAAVDRAADAVAGSSTPFSVEPSADEPVLVSSLVLGKNCAFVPSGSDTTTSTVDYLRAGNCDVQPNASGMYSPQNVIWTLVRVTPTGNLTRKPPKKWKATFRMVDAKDHKLAEEPVRWLTASDGSFVATAAFELSNPKLNLANGEYAIVFQLKGPGVEGEYDENAPFMIYGAVGASQR